MLQKEARERYPNLSKEEKGKTQKEAPERYQHFTEEGKEKNSSKILSEEKKRRNSLSIEEIII